jgi:hypothetical protein
VRLAAQPGSKQRAEKERAAGLLKAAALSTACAKKGVNPQAFGIVVYECCLYGFMANAQKPLFASSTNRAFTNPALTSVFVRPFLDWPE